MPHRDLVALKWFMQQTHRQFYQPTLRELSVGMGYKSCASAGESISNWYDHGFATRTTRKQTRAIVLTQKAFDWFERFGDR